MLFKHAFLVLIIGVITTLNYLKFALLIKNIPNLCTFLRV
jgi:hypothetical protein